MPFDPPIFLENHVANFSQWLQKKPVWRSKISNINFWIENESPPLPPLGTFPKIRLSYLYYDKIKFSQLHFNQKYDIWVNGCRFDDGSLFTFLQKDIEYFEQERSKENQSTRGKVCQRNKTPFSPAISAFLGRVWWNKTPFSRMVLSAVNPLVRRNPFYGCWVGTTLTL